GAEEHLEQLAGVGLGNTDAVVDDARLHGSVFRRPDVDLDEGVYAVGVVVKLDGVVDEVFEHDAHEFLVGLDFHFRTARDLLADLDFGGQPFFALEHHDLVDDAVEVDARYGYLRVVDLVDDEQAREYGVESFRGEVEFAQVVEGEFVADVHERDVTHALERREWSADIV